MQPERRVPQVRYLVRIHDDGPFGARVEYIDRPDGNSLYDHLEKPCQNCPGLGGWKIWNGRWVTWVKGPRISVGFCVVFDAPNAAGSDPGKPSAVYAADRERSVLVGEPVGLPQFFKTRIVVDVLTLSRLDSLSDLHPLDVEDVISSVLAAEYFSSESDYIGKVKTSSWSKAPRSEGVRLAERLENEIFSTLPESAGLPKVVSGS